VKRLVAVALALAAPVTPVEAHKPTKTRFTYHKDVRPIFEKRCGSCHREGGAAPMSLLRYKDTFPWAVAIKNHVLALSMPPWFADERYGTYRHSSSLTASEVDTIVDWCLGGTPEGNPGDSPARGAAVEIREDEPDLVLPIPQAFVLEAGRGEAAYEALLETALPRERFLRAIEFQPERANVIRSALVYLVQKGPTPGAPVWSWIAGESLEAWPEGRGLRLPKGAALLVRIHYKKTWLDEGKEIRDRSSIGLYLSKGRTKPIESLVVEEKGEVPIGRGIEVLSVLPRVEGRPESLGAEVALPDGTVLPLIRLREPDPAWPRTYRFETPVSLPKGSRLRMTSSAPDGAHSLVLHVVRK
jgi:hypothetical protein